MVDKLVIKTADGVSPFRIYVKTATGMERCPVYKKTLLSMERLDVDEEIPTITTKTFSGYPDWCNSFRSTSKSGVAYANFTGATQYNRIYQGLYGSYIYHGLMCFKSIFKQVKECGGTIKHISLRLTNDHAYYSSGLDTIICGQSNMPDTKPSSFSFTSINGNEYTSKTHFNRDETITLELTGNIIDDIMNDNIDGFKLVSPTGYTLSHYGYFHGTGNNVPFIEIIVEK